MREASVQFHDELPDHAGLREEVLRGLRARPRRLPPKLFYDRRGSELFDAICRLPEYYLTRTEMAILRANSTALAPLAATPTVLIELGSGASQKIRLLLDTLRPRAYVGVDISRDFLLQSTRRLAADYPWLKVYAVCTDFCQPLQLSCCAPELKRLAFFPGSSIGNFELEEAARFLRQLRALLGADGVLLIGVDLKKDTRVLHAAYNDAQGVTAEFNLNLLRRLQRELGAQLDAGGFRHESFYDDKLGRIEMHLVSRRAQQIRIGHEVFHFDKDERVHTENSYKYSVEEFQALARRAGYDPQSVWTDADRLFSVHCLRVSRS
jgi:dimethylhistidine N-methyltransferase